MGIYTSFRFKATIKPEYREKLQEIIENYEWIDNGLPGVKGWMEFSRCNFIPWSCEVTKWDDGDWFSHSEWDGETWTVCGALKNYGGEIEYFFREVLSPIIETLWFCQTWHEEAMEPTNWVLASFNLVDKSQQLVVDTPISVCFEKVPQNSPVYIEDEKEFIERFIHES